MTIVEYLETHKMKQVELAKLSGVPVGSINRHIHHGNNFAKKYADKLEKLGIECNTKAEKDLSGFDHFRNGLRYMLNSDKKADVIYCWSKEQVDYATQRLNSRKIAYYCYYKDCYWVIHYDKNLDISDQVC